MQPINISVLLFGINPTHLFKRKELIKLGSHYHWNFLSKHCLQILYYTSPFYEHHAFSDLKYDLSLPKCVVFIGF